MACLMSGMRNSVMQFVRDCGGFLLALGSEADIINGNVS